MSSSLCSVLYNVQCTWMCPVPGLSPQLSHLLDHIYSQPEPSGHPHNPSHGESAPWKIDLVTNSLSDRLIHWVIDLFIKWLINSFNDALIG